MTYTTLAARHGRYPASAIAREPCLRLHPLLPVDGKAVSVETVPHADIIIGKQAEGWWLEQPEPGILVWRVPSGRTYTTTPTVYKV